MDGPCRYDWQGVDASAPGMTAIRPVSGGVFLYERGIHIYDDHLRRDRANFTPDFLSPFHCWHGVMAGSTSVLHFTAFDAARHAYDGKRWPVNDEPYWIAWSNALSVVVTNARYSVPK